jgi:hypothetical protein
MSGKSSITTTITLRLPKDCTAIVDRRIASRTCLPRTRAQYCQDILILQLRRKHIRTREK